MDSTSGSHSDGSNRVGRESYEVNKIVSGLDGVAEVYRLDGTDLRAYETLPCRGEVWTYFADATGGSLGSSEHRGRAGKALNRRIPSVAWYCARIFGRSGNFPDFIRKAGADSKRDQGQCTGKLRGDQQNADGPDALAF